MTPSVYRPRPTAVELLHALAQRTTTVTQIVQDTLHTIAALEPQLHAWQHLAADAALARARTLDAQLQTGGEIGLLGGIPLAIKDIFDTAHMPTGYGSAVYTQHQPTRDAWVVERLHAAGSVAMGKTVTTEFAYFRPGPTANPWNPAHTPGGSSSGSAAAVASGMVPLALGSQTAGSLIRPASYCGVMGIKMTHGAIPLTGAKAFAPSLDTMGWLAHTADDLELLRCAFTGQPYTALPMVSTPRLLSTPTFEADAMDAGGWAAWHTAQQRLGRNGALQAITLPAHLAGLMEAQKTAMAYEAAQHLATERDHHAEHISPQIQALVDTGRAVTTADYQSALALAHNGRNQVLDLLGDADALLVPAAPGEAPAGLAATGDPIFSRVWTLLGLPNVSVPGLLGPNGLPIGMQLVGKPGQERHLLAVAKAVHAQLRAA